VPFTISHVAAVLPAHRVLSRAHLFSAAVIGSMVPDFGLLWPQIPDRVQTHSVSALLTFCLPVGLLAYLLVAYLVKPAALEVLPDNAYARVREADARSGPIGVRSWPLVGISILLGAVTHIVWDGFTHENARGVRMFPVLDEYGPTIDGHSVQLYRWLQHGSSLIGLVVVVVALTLWLRHAPAPAVPLPRLLRVRERNVWISLHILLPLLVLIATVWHTHHAHFRPVPLPFAAEVIAVLGMRAGAATLLLMSLLLGARLRLYRPRSP
jgi:hypothetical protein